MCWSRRNATWAARGNPCAPTSLCPNSTCSGRDSLRSNPWPSMRRMRVSFRTTEEPNASISRPFPTR
ncbi:MAG: hypothetical protein DMF95_22315, partial [Acidobacteria bacterium]